MTFEEFFRQGVLEQIGKGKRFPSVNALAKAADVEQSSLSKCLTRHEGMVLNNISKVLDTLGAVLVFPDEKNADSESPHELRQKYEQVLAAHKEIQERVIELEEMLNRRTIQLEFAEKYLEKAVASQASSVRLLDNGQKNSA